MADPDLDAVAAAYRRALVGGRLTEFPLTPYDRTGIPVVATVWDDDVPGRGDAHGVGYGTTTAAATVGALGEVAERVLLAPALRDLPRRRASYADLRREVGTDGEVWTGRCGCAASTSARSGSTNSLRSRFSSGTTWRRCGMPPTSTTPPTRSCS